MTRCLLLAVLFVATTFSYTAHATVEFSCIGQKYWSNNEYLGNAASWGIMASKSLSNKMDFRMSYERIDNNSRMLSVIYLFYPPFGDDITYEMIRTQAAVNIWDVTLGHCLVEGNRMRLDIGGGFALALLELLREGESSGRRTSSNEEKLMAVYYVESTVKEFIGRPLALKMGYRHRRSIFVGGYATDSFTPFDDIALSGVYAALVARW